MVTCWSTSVQGSQSAIRGQPCPLRPGLIASLDLPICTSLQTFGGRRTVPVSNGPRFLGDSHRPAGSWSGRGPPEWFPRSLLNRLTGSVLATSLQHRHDYAAGIDRGLLTDDINRSRVLGAGPRCALQPSPYPSDLSWWAGARRGRPGRAGGAGLRAAPGGGRRSAWPGVPCGCRPA